MLNGGSIARQVYHHPNYNEPLLSLTQLQIGVWFGVWVHLGANHYIQSFTFRGMTSKVN